MTNMKSAPFAAVVHSVQDDATFSGRRHVLPKFVFHPHGNNVNSANQSDVGRFVSFLLIPFVV